MPSRIPRAILLLATGIGLSACREPMGVCDLPHACEVPGYDLEVVNALLANPVGTDTETGLLVAPPSLRVRFTVRNRGSEVSPAGGASLELGGLSYNRDAESEVISIPPLDPGYSVTLGASLTILHTYLPARTDIWKARAGILENESGPDADPTNDALYADEMHLAVPLVEFRVQPIGVPRLFVNEPFLVRLTVANRARHATLHGVVAVVCLWNEDVACWPRQWTWFGRQALPDVQPGDSVDIVYTTAVTPTSAWQDEAYPTWTNYYCRFPHDDFLRVRPDYEGACAPPTLVPDETVVLPAINCGLMPPTSQGSNDWLEYYKFHLLALNTDVDVTWVVERSPNDQLYGIFDIEGEETANLAGGDSIRVSRAGRYYLPFYSRSDTLRATLRRH